MVLKDHDLKQIDRDYVEGLARGKLEEMTLRLLEDLREARDRLNQTPQNSSRPSGSFALWEGGIVSDGSSVEEVPNKEAEEEERKKKKKRVKKQSGSVENDPEKKKAGKQPGAKGHGRKVELEVTGVEVHKAEECAACGEKLGEEAEFEARTGLYVLDIEMGNPGLQVSHVKHRFGYAHYKFVWGYPLQLRAYNPDRAGEMRERRRLGR
jgi:hypothetical protein